MSKLYNTLEQIRVNEVCRTSGRNHASGRDQKIRRKGRQVLCLLVLAAGLVVLLNFALPVIPTYLPYQKILTAKIGTDQDSSSLPWSNKSAGYRTLSQVPERVPPIGPEPHSMEEQQSRAESIEIATKENQKLITLINRGAGCIQKQEYWKGLYYLDQARKMQPQRIEPLINSAVALAELGLYELAVQYFNEARSIDPEHPLLKENLAILSKYGIAEENLFPSMARRTND